MDKEKNSLLKTECTAGQLEFRGLGRCAVVGQFDGGKISSDSGGLLLREVERRTHILKRLAGCFVDYRDPDQIEHTVESLIKQRVMGLALGYEDLNDHDTLRHDSLLALLSDKQDLSGKTRKRDRDKGCALAGKSTLNRLELSPPDADAASRYKKIVADIGGMDDLLVDLFLEAHDTAPADIILDVDATDDPLHGNQEGRFFHGYYRSYCYLPLYIFCEEHLLCARLRTADQDGAAGTVDELARIVERIRSSWPKTRIIVRGDSGFCREDLMAWCEAQSVEYVLGVPKNSRLKTILAEAMAQARSQYEATELAARVFKDFRYQTRTSWSCERRVIGKAEHLAKGENPRFVVTTLSTEEWDACSLYEDLYCARGDMENRIKEQQLALFADRTSTHEMRSNQLRLYFSSFAYVLMQTLRYLGLEGTSMARAQCDTIRLRLFKVGAHIRISVRRVRIAFSESYPYADLFRQIMQRLQQIPLRC
jgi:hypothetical protein